MLGKLMKYDLRSMLRKFGPLWIAAVALSVVCGLYFRLMDSVSSSNFLMKMFVGLLPAALFGIFVAMAVMALIFVCSRFYSGLLGDEGYLMHTLPVTAGAHIASKGLTALILEIVSGLVALLCITLVAVTYSGEELLRGWREFLAMFRQLDFPAATPWLVAEGVIVAIAATAAETLKIYAAISLGHLAKKHRVLWAVLAYVGIDVVLNILFGFGVSSGLLMRILGSGSWGFFADSGEITAHGLGMMAGAMGSVLFWEVLLGTGFFFLSRFILKKHLNLE
ncbi:MAG: hypothetical protein IJP64_04240 [Oscillospiraceae bacterium]|nr:hypothetical protein [Oscillospiraceae bacterium]